MANAHSPDNPHTQIIRDYFAYKLKSRDLHVPGYEPQQNVSEPYKTLRRIGDELEASNQEIFSNMCTQLNITQNTAYPTFRGIADEIFQTGKNWGRIVAFICFGANLAVHCARRADLGPQYVDNIVNWVSRYIESNLENWLSAHDSWDGFVKFFKDSKANDDRFAQGFFISTLAGLGLGALFMLACK